MFNLLVKGAGWAGTRDTMPEGRALEFTEPHLVERFRPKDILALRELIAFPALFLEESSHSTNPVARVGTITRARVSGREIALEYAYDSSIPALTNNLLKGFAADLDIDEFEFTRTHWAVKDVDLCHLSAAIASCIISHLGS